MVDPDIPRDNDSPVVDSAEISALLLEHGYTQGLVQGFLVNKQAFESAFWVIDNSGSMRTMDGHCIVEGSSEGAAALKFEECSRWAEMQETVVHHARIAALLKTPTTFRLLNESDRDDSDRVAGPQIFSIALGDGGGGSIDHDLSVAVATMQNTQPDGVTLLTQHIEAIRETVTAMQPQLTQNGTKIAIVIATDGMPSDEEGYSYASVKQEFVDALRSMEGLPVKIVVRLFTDEEEVVQFWNDLDSQLELSLDVLDDFVSEAREIYKKNPWLTYGLPLHRIREMGFQHPSFDLLDERKLSRDEVRDFLHILFGSFEAPDPQGDWKGFTEAVELLMAKEKDQWNPVHGKIMPWIDTEQL